MDKHSHWISKLENIGSDLIQPLHSGAWGPWGPEKWHGLAKGSQLGSRSRITARHFTPGPASSLQELRPQEPALGKASPHGVSGPRDVTTTMKQIESKPPFLTSEAGLLRCPPAFILQGTRQHVDMEMEGFQWPSQFLKANHSANLEATVFGLKKTYQPPSSVLIKASGSGIHLDTFPFVFQALLHGLKPVLRRLTISGFFLLGRRNKHH